MIAKIFKINFLIILTLLTAIGIKYFLLDDPHVNKFVKLAHLFVQVERYFVGVGYNYFHRENFITKLGLSKNIITEKEISDDEILKYYQIPSLIDDHKIEIKIIANKKIFLSNNLHENFKNILKNNKSPTILYVHGGGYVFKGIETKLYKNFTDLGFIYIFVYYRLAPEYKFPCQIEDVFSVLKYLSKISETNFTENIQDLEARNLIEKINPNDLILMGDSAGGNLIASLAILAKTRNLSNKINIKYQIFLFTGMFIMGDLPSRTTYKNWYLISWDVIEWFVVKYIKNEEDIKNKLISPFLYDDETLKNLPVSYFIEAERDPLFSEGELYKNKLISLGNRVISKIYPAEHGFIYFPEYIPEAQQAIEELISFMKQEYELN